MDHKIDIEEFNQNFPVSALYCLDVNSMPRSTILLYDISLSSNHVAGTDHLRGVFRNGDGHAEQYLLELLQEVKESELYGWEETNSIDIKIIQNYSPCSGCAEEICDFIKSIEEQDENILNINVKIVFSNIYKIHGYNGKSEEIARENIFGLMNLLEAGVELCILKGEENWTEEVLNERNGDLFQSCRHRKFLCDQENCRSREDRWKRQIRSEAREIRERVDEIYLSKIIEMKDDETLFETYFPDHFHESALIMIRESVVSGTD